MPRNNQCAILRSLTHPVAGFLDVLTGADGSYMVHHKAGEVRRGVVDGVVIIGSLARADSVTPLPEQVGRDTSGAQGCSLPLALDIAFIRGNTVLFEKAWLSSSGASSAMVGYPSITPGVADAPCACSLVISLSRKCWMRARTLRRIQVDGTKVDSVDGDEIVEGDTLVCGVWVAAIRSGGDTHSLCEGSVSIGILLWTEGKHTISHTDHVLRIERLDVRAGALDPASDD